MRAVRTLVRLAGGTREAFVVASEHIAGVDVDQDVGGGLGHLRRSQVGPLATWSWCSPVFSPEVAPWQVSRSV